MEYIIKRIRDIIEEAEAMKNAYFWESPCKAHDRRKYEERHSHPVVEWSQGGHTYTAEYTVSCSCKNIYAHGTYTKDGNKTTITAIKNSLKRLQKMANIQEQ